VSLLLQPCYLLHQLLGALGVAQQLVIDPAVQVRQLLPPGTFLGTSVGDDLAGLPLHPLCRCHDLDQAVGHRDASRSFAVIHHESSEPAPGAISRGGGRSAGSTVTM
jgi:hypothetical protein